MKGQSTLNWQNPDPFCRKLELIHLLINLRITIELVPGLSDCQCRALSLIKRYDTSFVIIRIQIIVPNIHLVEVVGHEFEHTLEQIEGLDLRALASTQSDYVYRSGSGEFETIRAMRAGRVIES